MEKNGRATISVGDGNGGQKLIIDMHLWQWIFAVVIAALAIFGGTYKAVYAVSTEATQNWYETTGRTKVQEEIRSGILAHTISAQTEYQRDLTQINEKLTRLSTQVEAISR